MAKSRKDPWASEDSLPIREIDGTTHTDDDATPEEGTAASDGAVRSIVPAPRPYAYRDPIGTPEPDNKPRPRRRRTD